MSFTKVATIISTHALKGVLKVFSEINCFERMVLSGNVKDENNNTFEVESCFSTNKKEVFRIQLKDVNSIEEATKYLKKELFADTEHFKKKGEILVTDLLGLTVFCIIDNKQIDVGIVSEIVNYGKGSMMEIASKIANKKIPFVYPATFDFIEEINLEKKYLILKKYHSDIII